MILWAITYYLKKYCFSYYQGEISDHFDGKLFHNHKYGAGHAHSFFNFIKWRIIEKRAQWPDFIANNRECTPLSEVKGKEIRISMVGHATVLIQTQGLNFITDPVFSERASPFAYKGPKRIRNLGISFVDLPKIDVILLSHNHYDHMDCASLKAIIARDNPLIITPLGNEMIMLREGVKNAHVETLDWYQSHKINEDMEVILTPAVHWSSRWELDRNRALWGGFILRSISGNIYFAGDTGYGNGTLFKEIRQRYGLIKLAILPIGAYEPRWFMRPVHFDPDDAVQAFLDLGEPQSIGMHFGVFPLTNEAYDDPEKDLDKATAKIAPQAKQKFKPMYPGETLKISS
jgi:L-ascorbate metabolism protein UlaG (beta-lactamase superfamily)